MNLKEFVSILDGRPFKREFKRYGVVYTIGLECDECRLARCSIRYSGCGCYCHSRVETIKEVDKS